VRSIQRINSSKDSKQSEAARKIAKLAMEYCIEQKARDVSGLDIRSITDIAEYFVIASGNSQRHVHGIVDRIKKSLRELDEEPISVNGYENADWVLLDYGNVVIHIFYEPIRKYYNLDMLWGSGKQIRLSEKLETAANSLRTGMYPAVGKS
jgi:ribosome-associated protein